LKRVHAVCRRAAFLRTPDKICAAKRVPIWYGPAKDPPLAGAAMSVPAFLMAPNPTSTKRNAATAERRLELEERTFELSKACPVDGSNPPECPLCGLRPMPARARRAWIKMLSDPELEYLATYHATCHAEKMAAKKVAGKQAVAVKRR
jgi:hypothetical protein